MDRVLGPLVVVAFGALFAFAYRKAPFYRDRVRLKLTLLCLGIAAVSFPLIGMTSRHVGEMIATVFWAALATSAYAFLLSPVVSIFQDPEDREGDREEGTSPASKEGAQAAAEDPPSPS